jgi:hypothetical protein
VPAPSELRGGPVVARTQWAGTLGTTVDQYAPGLSYGEVDELSELARTALLGKHKGEVAPQVTFLRALAKKVARAGDFTAPGKISRAPLLILSSDGTLSAPEQSLESILVGVPPLLTLETIAARLVAFASGDEEVLAAAEIIRDQRPLPPQFT